MRVSHFLLLTISLSPLLFTTCEKYDVNEEGIPQFVDTDFIELDKIERISKFRSGSGHDFSDDFESCRSMKHYFSMDSAMEPSNNVTSAVFASVSGKIIKLKDENNGEGKQCWIRPDDYPAFTIRIFHVYPVESIKDGDHILAGDRIGSTTNTDIAVQVRTPDGIKFLSYFEIMTDELFAHYQSRGISSRDDLIISREERDASPIECTWDETFPDQYSTYYEDWVFLN